ncbi:CBS domain-containing protein [Thalassotalea euphylliae]|uniref:CBS domain-containing protein n=1 Tax=Thalassotalea euphylliae TaxID=1655234 RepID=A0A3E0UHB9_9GAMM|nr:CBS domain-containing protein [Thalassotalea euphylliae]REL35152.1 CBS domain-containing protein [Thalassotalea euphylliae]
MLSVAEFMTRDVIKINLDERLNKVKEIFDQYKFHHLLVVDNNNALCGVLSDRDLFRALSPNVGLASETARDAATLNKRVHQIAARNPICLPTSASLTDVVKQLHEHQVTCMPIVDENKRPVGIVTTKDIIRLLHDKIEPSNTNL